MPQAPAPQGRSVCVLASQGAAVVMDGCKQTRESQTGTDRVPGHTAQQPVLRVSPWLAERMDMLNNFAIVKVEQQIGSGVSTFCCIHSV